MVINFECIAIMTGIIGKIIIVTVIVTTISLTYTVDVNLIMSAYIANVDLNALLPLDFVKMFKISTFITYSRFREISFSSLRHLLYS